MHQKRRLFLFLILPDGSKSLIPADWTDLASPTQSLSAPTATTIGSLENLLHARAVVDALLGRLAPVIGEDEIPRRRAPLREKNRSLFDLLLDETYPWETLLEKYKNLAIQILARLIVQAALDNQKKGKSHE